MHFVMLRVHGNKEIDLKMWVPLKMLTWNLILRPRSNSKEGSSETLHEISVTEFIWPWKPASFDLYRKNSSF